MKKNIIVFLSFFCMYTYAMQEHKVWEGMIHGTNVMVKRACIVETKCNESFPTNIVIVGENQQRMLKGNYEFDWQVGAWQFLEDDERSIYVRYHKDDSASDDENFKPIEYYGFKKMEERSLTRKMSCDVLTIAEPIISTSRSARDIDALRYYAENGREQNKDLYMKSELKGHQAINAALVDLEMCYKTVLLQGLERLIAKKVKFKKIAIATLSTECAGCLREEGAISAVKALIEFLQDNSHQYSVIEFYVKKVAEFEAFKKLLEEYVQLYLSPVTTRKKLRKSSEK